jgi:N-acetyl-1-D-myo-inositol-2-amino-2-deoxy-alpha-D-glucopyranoside deacetylase
MHEVRPQVLITYDENGFYGHPDHIQAHRVAMRAAELAGDDAPQKIYWTAMPRSVLEGGMEAFRGLDDNPFADVEKVEDLPFGSTDEQIACRIDGTDFYERKVAAMRAHATQIPDNSWLYGIAGDFGGEFMGVEYYTLAKGERGEVTGPYGWESDLFSGVHVTEPVAR